jgi:hypothetical protein
MQKQEAGRRQLLEPHHTATKARSMIPPEDHCVVTEVRSSTAAAVEMATNGFYTILEITSTITTRTTCWLTETQQGVNSKMLVESLVMATGIYCLNTAVIMLNNEANTLEKLLQEQWLPIPGIHTKEGVSVVLYYTQRVTRSH